MKKKLLISLAVILLMTACACAMPETQSMLETADPTQDAAKLADPELTDDILPATSADESNEFSPDYESEDEINTVGITAGNLTNAFMLNGEWYAGLLTYQGDWVYFARIDEDLAIYKMRADGEGYQRLADVQGTCLNVVGDWLYFCNNADGDKLYRMLTDGSQVTKLNDAACGFLSVSGDRLHYIDYSQDGCLFSSNLDGSESIRLTDFMVINPYAPDGWVYYLETKPDDAGFYRVSVLGGESQYLAPAWAGNYCIDGDWVYYADNDSIRRMSTDGSEAKRTYMNEEPITTFNTSGSMLYLSAGLLKQQDGYTTGNTIIAIDNEKREIAQTFEFHTEPIYTGPDGWIYLLNDIEGLALYSMSPEGSVTKVGP